MFNDLLRLKDQSLSDTFNRVVIHGKPFVSVSYNHRIIGFVNQTSTRELGSPFLDTEPMSGILEGASRAFKDSNIPPAVEEMVMYMRGLMMEV